MNRHLHVELVGDRQALIDRRRRRAPVLVQLQAERAGANLLAQRLGADALPLPRKPKFSGNASTASYIRRMFHAPGVQVVAFVPVAGPVPPPISVVMPEWNASGIWFGEMKCTCESMRAGGQDVPFAGEDFGRGADLQARRDAVHDARDCPALPIAEMRPSRMPTSAL